jgi:hypothetical protein
MNRREFIGLVASSGLMLGLGWYLGGRRTPPPPDVEGPPADSLFPSDTGSLAEGQKAVLWRLAQEAGAVWGMARLAREDFMNVVELKTQRAPSYLAEYRSAIDLFAASAPDAGSEQVVPSLLKGVPFDDRQQEALKSQMTDDTDLQRRLSHMRQFVLAEFLRLHLARGGCQQLQLVRYPGFMGSAGPYLTAKPTRRGPKP